MEAETESFREAGNLNILAGFESPQLLLILNSHLICQGSLTGNDWIRMSQVTYAHTTGRRSFHVESPGPDSDISCRRLCGQQWRVRLSSCCGLDRIWEESRCFHGPGESRMLVFQSTSPPPPPPVRALMNPSEQSGVSTVFAPSTWGNLQKLCGYLQSWGMVQAWAVNQPS